MKQREMILNDKFHL